jgi:hypothetical protein
MGSGEVTPGPAFDPGLVYDSGIVGWLQYGCGVGIDLGYCDQVGAIPANQLNYPSIAAGALPGTQTITRTVTSVDTKPDSYEVKVTAPAGYKVKASPDHFTIQPGQKVSYSVSITRTTAPLNAYAFGQLVWKDQRGHSVRSPISIQGVALAAPSEVTGSGATGSQALSVKSGYNGTLSTSVQGLAQSTVAPETLDDAVAFNPNAPAASSSTERVDTVIPAGTAVARFATYAEDYPAGTDVDVFVYRIVSGTLRFVAQSAGGSATEAVTIRNPIAGATYVMFENAFAVPGPSIDAMPNVFLVPNSAAGNLTATPTSQSVTLGNPATVTLSWSGLAAGRYLGVVNFSDGTNAIGSTLVAVNN